MPRKILLCPNAFKGSLTAAQAAQAMKEGIDQTLRETGAELETICLPLADGGDGTLELFFPQPAAHCMRKSFPIRWGVRLRHSGADSAAHNRRQP